MHSFPVCLVLNCIILRTNVYIHDTTNTENTNAVVFWHWLHTRRHIERIIWVPCHSRGVGIHFEDGVVYFEYMPDSCRNNNGMSLVCSNLSCHIYNFVMKYCLNGLWKCPYAWQKKTSRTQRTKCLVINYILFVLLGLCEENKKKQRLHLIVAGCIASLNENVLLFQLQTFINHWSLRAFWDQR